MARSLRIGMFAMPSSTIILLLSSVFGHASAVPWAVAKETATYKADEWSPRPTNTPLAARDIFKRSSVDVDVCGWIGGNSAQPVGCASGSSCIHDSSGFVGCCPTSSAGASPIPCTDGVYTTCIDKNSAGYSENSFLINNGVLSCPTASNCYRIIYPESYTQFGCGPSTADITAETSFAGQATDLRLQIVYTGVSFDPAITIQNPSVFGAATSFPTSTVSTTASSSDAAASATAGKGSLTNSTPQSTSSAASSGSKGNSSTGAIVGGTIGALVVVIGAAILAFFLIKRRGNQRQSGTPRSISSPKRQSKAATFESIPDPTPSPQPPHSPLPFNPPAPEPREYVSPMSITNNQGYAPIYQSPYHRPTTPIEPVEAPTPDPYVPPRNFRSPSPNPDPFEPPYSQILPSSYDPIRSRNLSRSPDPQNHSPYIPPSSQLPNPPYLALNLPQTQSPLLPHHMATNPNPNPSINSPSLPLRRPSPAPPPLDTSPSTAPPPPPPRNSLPPLDLMEDTQTPLVPKATAANWHLALTGDRRTYTPADDSIDILHQNQHEHEPMPAIPALYADLTHDLGIESMSPPEGSFLFGPGVDAEVVGVSRVVGGSGNGSGGSGGGTKRNFSRKGRAEKNSGSGRSSAEDENGAGGEKREREKDAAQMSGNIQNEGWSPEGLRTRGSPSPHVAERFRSREGSPEDARREMGGGNGHSKGTSEEVRIAYNPGLGVQMGMGNDGMGMEGGSAMRSSARKPVGSGSGRGSGSIRGSARPPPGRPSPGMGTQHVVVDERAVEGGWL